MVAERTRPNILITGTPGTGKTTLSELVATSNNMKHMQASQLVKENGLHDGYNDEFDTYMLDEDKLCDYLEPYMEEGGMVLDFHSCDFFPERWFDLVVVLRTDNSVLYERLIGRGYSERKISENIQCEIMQVLIEEARDSYDEEIVVELESNDVDDMENNLDRITEWIAQWTSQHQ